MKTIKVIIPSRKRSQAVKRALRLVPSATLLVHESEKKEYAEQVGDVPIVTHQIVGTLSEIRQHALDVTKEDCVFFCDDDLVAVKSIHSGKIYENPVDIMRIILNGFHIADDLGISIFCYNRCPNPLQYHSFDPIAVVAPATSAFGVIGRKLHFDARMSNRVDVDITMLALQNERIIFQDRRFYFDVGAFHQGRGGLQGKRTSENEQKEDALMRRKWGGYFYGGTSKSVLRKGKSNSGAMAIRVVRKQPLSLF